MNKLFFILFFISFIISQGNYQILSSPSNFNNTFKGHDFYQDKNYSVFHSSLPSDISIFSATISSKVFKNEDTVTPYFITLKNIDYGTLKDSETNYKFSAQESAIELAFLKEDYLEDIDFFFNIGYMKSSIDIFDSEAIYIGLKSIIPVFNDDEIILGFDNFGNVLDSYSDTSIQLPETVSLSYSINLKLPISIFFNYETRLDLNRSVLHGTLQLDLNPQLDLYISTRSDRTNLFYGDYIQELTAGFSRGLGYVDKTSLFNFGIQDLGPAGYTSSFSFSKAIL